MLVSNNLSALAPSRSTAPSEAKPEPVRQSPAKAEDEAQLIAFVSNLTRADAAQVIALTQRDASPQTYDTVASAYSEF